MGTYNGEKRISKAIQSIINQTYTNWELIICDDGSTDNTYLYLQKKYRNNPQIKILSLSANSGLAAALNKCLTNATGTVIARMDDDDWSHPNRFEKQIEYMKHHPEYSIIGTSINYFDEKGVYGTCVLDEKEKSKRDIYKGDVFVHPTVIIKKDALLSVGNYTDSPKTLRCEDYELWCKLYDCGYIGINMPDVLLDYYESRESISRRKRIYLYKLALRKLYWRRRFEQPFYMDYYAFREILISMIPTSLVSIMRRYKIKK